MSQLLNLANGTKAIVDVVYGDGGTPARQASMGGTIIQLSEGRQPYPMIARHGDRFFYLTDKLDPVTDPAHVEGLPKEAREAALAFIESTKGKKVAPPTVSEKKGKALAKKSISKQAQKAGKAIKDLDSLREEAGAHVVGVAD